MKLSEVFKRTETFSGRMSVYQFHPNIFSIDDMISCLPMTPKDENKCYILENRGYLCRKHRGLQKLQYPHDGGRDTGDMIYSEEILKQRKLRE